MRTLKSRRRTAETFTIVRKRAFALIKKFFEAPFTSRFYANKVDCGTKEGILL